MQIAHVFNAQHFVDLLISTLNLFFIIQCETNRPLSNDSQVIPNALKICILNQRDNTRADHYRSHKWSLSKKDKMLTANLIFQKMRILASEKRQRLLFKLLKPPACAQKFNFIANAGVLFKLFSQQQYHEKMVKIQIIISIK